MDKATVWQKVEFYDTDADRAVALAFLATDGIKKIAKCLKLGNRVRRIERLPDFDVWREDKTGFRFSVAQMS